MRFDYSLLMQWSYIFFALSNQWWMHCMSQRVTLCWDKSLLKESLELLLGVLVVEKHVYVTSYFDTDQTTYFLRFGIVWAASWREPCQGWGSLKLCLFVKTGLILDLRPANETALLCSDISHWLDASLELALVRDVFALRKYLLDPSNHIHIWQVASTKYECNNYVGLNY